MAEIYIPESEIKLKAINYGQRISEGIQIENGSYTEMALQQGINGYKDGYIACLNDLSNANRNIWELLESKTRLNKAADIYFQSENTHSYADTEEELKEDITKAFKAGYKACEAEFVKLYGQFCETKK